MNLRYRLHREPESLDVVMILPGISGGMNHSLVRGVFEAAAERGFNVLTFDYLGFLRGNNYPSENLAEEIDALAHATDVLGDEGVRRLHLIGKSLGAVVASRALTEEDYDTNPLFSLDPVKFTVLGFAPDDISYDGLDRVELEIIQGEHDRFGSPAKVSKALLQHGMKDIRITGIKGATHSFRDVETDTKPIYENEAIEEITWLDNNG